MNIKHETQKVITSRAVIPCDSFIIEDNGRAYRFEYEDQNETQQPSTALTFSNKDGSIMIDIEAYQSKRGIFQMGAEFQNRAGGWWYSWEEADKLGALNDTIKAKTDKAAFKIWIVRHFSELMHQVRTKKN